MTQTVAQRIGRFVAETPATELLPAPMRREAGRTLLDTLACAIAGADEPATRLAARYAHQSSRGSGVAALWRPGETGLVSEESAAWANGVAGHALDYDDVTSPMRGHPSVAMWGALLAIAEGDRTPLLRTYDAYVVGFEVAVRLSRAMAQDHYVRGWHSTSTIGALAAAAACSRLLQLDAQQATYALGLAAAQSAGLRENFGSMARPVQAGQANLAGLRAARLAQLGFDASPSALDGPRGWGSLYGRGEDLFAAFADLGAARLELDRTGIDVKKYPMCYAVHRVLDGVLALRETNKISLADLEAVNIRASNGAFAPLIHHRPRTGLNAKFSLEFAVTAALLDGHVTLASFAEASVLRLEIQVFLPKVTGEEAAGSLLPRWVEISLRLKDGRELTTRVESLRGGADNPLSDAELVAKASDCLRFGGSAGDADALAQICADPRDATVEALLDAALGRTRAASRKAI